MGHTNNIPRRPLFAEQQLPALGFCVQCVADAKGAMAKLADTPLGESPAQAPEMPAVSPAIMLVGGTGCCFNHLQVQVQSPLLVPR